MNLLVASRRRAGSGIGARLLRDAIGIARRAGVEVLRVDCWAGSERLVAYYEEQGFTRAERFDVRGWPGQVLALELGGD